MVSVIIPALNEAENIGKLVTYIKEKSGGLLAEIIVSDGGSFDNTAAKAKQAGAVVVISPSKGRSVQMNFAVGYATGSVLYFVHADTLPPDGFVKDIEEAVAKGYEIGRYRTRFDSNNLLLKVNAFFTRYDWFICYGGDQTLFITKRLFEKINGYRNNMSIMEDYDIVKRARKFAKYKILKKTALISARKYQTNSWIKVQLANRKIVNMYKKGASQEEMVKSYKKMLIYR